MKNLLKNSIVILLLCAAVSSCQKESIESIEPNSSTTTQVQDEPTNDGNEFENNSRETGCNLLPRVEYDKISKVADGLSVQSLPSSYYLACPPIRDQGSEGSCVAFGTAYAARSIAKYYKSGASSYSNSTNLYSPEYIYNQIKINSSCASGSYVTSALQKMKSIFIYGGGGVCTWGMMPYSSTNGCNTMPNSSQISNAYANYINGYSTVLCTVTAIKNQLVQKRGVIVAGPVDLGFKNLGNNQMYTHYISSSSNKNHCYCVVGYSDAKHAFKVMNSWGTGWGTSGFGWIDYDVVSYSVNYPFYMEIPKGFWEEAYVITSSI